MLASRRLAGRRFPWKPIRSEALKGAAAIEFVPIYGSPTLTTLQLAAFTARAQQQVILASEADLKRRLASMAKYSDEWMAITNEIARRRGAA